MQEEERAKLIEAVNELRLRLGYVPLTPEELQSMSDEDLQEQYNRLQQIVYPQMAMGKPKRSKLLWIIPILIVIIAVPLYFFFPRNLSVFKKPQQINRPVTDFMIGPGQASGNSLTVLLHNSGTTAIPAITVKLDNTPVSFKITSGHLPLKAGQDLSFLVPNACNGSKHTIAVEALNLTKNLVVYPGVC